MNYDKGRGLPRPKAEKITMALQAEIRRSHEAR